MLLNLVGPLASSHAVFYPLLPHVGGRLSPPRLAPTSLNLITANAAKLSRGRRRTGPNSALSGPRFLHPRGSFPEGVPSSLFTLQPPTSFTPTEYPSKTGGGSSSVAADGTVTAVAAPPTSSAVEDVTEALDVRLVEESDLPDISALLAEVREQNRRAASHTAVHQQFFHAALLGSKQFGVSLRLWR